MEVYWLLLVDTWKTCATLDPHYATPTGLTILISIAGSGKSVLWFVLI